MATRKRIWDNYQVVAEVQKSDKLKLVISAGTRDGYRCISIREFYKRIRDNEWMPGRDGITIPIAAPINKKDAATRTIIHPMQDVLDALPEVVRIAKTMALADPEHEVWSTPKTKEETK